MRAERIYFQQSRGQILIETLIALAAFLLFISAATQICETAMIGARRFRLTDKEKHGNQITRYRDIKKISPHHHLDIHSVFHNRDLSR